MEFLKKHLRKILLLALLSAVYALGMYLLNVVRPSVIEAQCSDMAVRSSNIIFKDIDSAYNYDNVKERCISDVKRNM